MNSFASIADFVGRALLHSVWEGAVIAMLFAIAMLVLRKRSAQARYLTACTSLLLMLLAPIATIMSHPTPQPVQREIVANVSVQPIPVVSALTPRDVAPMVVTPRRPALSMLQYATIVWAMGLLIVSLWQIAGWLTVRRFVRTAQPADALALDRLQRLCDRLRVRFPIALRVCEQLTTPALVGWLRPVILIPPAALCDLPVDYFESLLLHELAHVRRHDYLVNLLQTIAETLLFYHPAAWWVSRMIRDERENCCDDEVVRQTDAKTYVRALALMESQRADTVGNLALTATGGRLLHRIERLTGHSGNRRPAAGTIATLVLLCGVIVVTACYAAKTPANPQTSPAAHGATDIKGPTRGVLPEDLVISDKAADYRIQPGDRLSIAVGELTGPGSLTTRTVNVSSSGTITLYLVKQPLAVAGMTEAEVEPAVTKAYHDERLIERAMVSVNVTEARGQSFAVVGAVAHAGQFPLADPHFRVLNAIATAGGTVGSDIGRVVVLREAGEAGQPTTAIVIPADRLLSGDPSVNLVIRPRDTVVVNNAGAAMPMSTPSVEGAIKPDAPPGTTIDQPAGDYRIARNDNIQIQVSNLTGPNTETVKQSRVSESGGIRVPLLPEPIHAAGLSEIQLERAIMQAYKEAQVPEHPVSVTVIEAHGRTHADATPAVPVPPRGFTDSPVAPGMGVFYGLYLDGRGPHGPQFMSSLMAPVSKSGDIRLDLLMDKPIHVEGLSYDALKRAMNKAYSDAGYDAGAVQWVSVSPPTLPMEFSGGKVDADHPPRHLLDVINQWGGIERLKVRQVRVAKAPLSNSDSLWLLTGVGRGVGREVDVEKLMAGDAEANVLLASDDVVMLR